MVLPDLTGHPALMTEERHDEAERPREDYPNPTQERIDEELSERKGWGTEDSPHQGDDGTEPA